MNVEFVIDGRNLHLAVEENRGEFRVTCGDRLRTVRCRLLSPGLYLFEIDGRARLVHVAADRDRTFVRIDGREVRLEKPRADRSRGAAEADAGISDDGIVETPMPGKIVKINVREGQTVGKDHTLLVVESMKMENAIAAPWDAVVRKVHVAEGDQTHLGQPLMEIEKIDS